jgi:hypothetical protein
MRNHIRKLCWFLYTALFLGAAVVSIMGYRQVALARLDRVHDRSTWLPKREIVHLIRYHGTDGLKITPEEVYIFRDAKWIRVMKRSRG